MNETPNKPRYQSLEDIFPVVPPKDKGQAIELIRIAWASLSPEERENLFSECYLGEGDSGKNWNELEYQQSLYETVLYKVYGDHKAPYIPLSERIHADEERRLAEASRGWFSRILGR